MLRDEYINKFSSEFLNLVKLIESKLVSYEAEKNIKGNQGRNERFFSLIRLGINSNANMILEIMYIDYLSKYEKEINDNNDVFFLEHEFNDDIPEEYRDETKAANEKSILEFINMLKDIWSTCNPKEKKIVWTRMNNIARYCLSYLLCKYDDNLSEATIDHVINFNRQLRFSLWNLYKDKNETIRKAIRSYFKTTFMNGTSKNKNVKTAYSIFLKVGKLMLDNHEEINNENLDLLKLREQNKHRIDYLFYLNNEYGYYESVWDWKYLHSMLLEYTTYQIHLSTKL